MKDLAAFKKPVLSDIAKRDCAPPRVDFRIGIPHQLRLVTSCCSKRTVDIFIGDCACPSLLAEEKDEERRTALLEAVRNGSAATWAHFNLHGEFDFSDERMVD